MINPPTSKIDINNRVIEYSDILQIYGVAYEPAEYYWQIGEMKQGNGWILYLSVIRIQIPALLHAIIPELIAYSVPFKVIRDYEITGTILDGSLGYALLGKMVSIYPENEQQALILAKKLISLTKAFRGPDVPTAKPLGAVVYAQYETIHPEGTQSSTPSHSAVAWPFNEIAPPELPKTGRLLNYAYYPIAILKADAKGDVIKALYFKKLWQIRSCLIKQGRSNMFSDDEGRNIQDRLQWQYDLYQELSGDIPIPGIFDYFTKGKDKYLAMEFIKGKSLTKFIFSVYDNRVWPDLPLFNKVQLLGTMVRIILIIERLHKRGYIHRDITPENFLIDREGRLSMIDMELAWSNRSRKPDPPFRLGTFGFMSPEQQQILTPTEKEDIYGLGGLLLVFFTNLFPMKFDTSSIQRLNQQIFFFTGEDQLAKLISHCMHVDPVQRPTLTIIKKELELYCEKIKNRPHPVFSYNPPPVNNSKIIKATIQLGLNGLVLPMLLTPKKRWASKVQKIESNLGNEQLDMTVYEGWHTGMAGPLWLVAKAKAVGFNIDPCQTTYSSSWRYIEEHYFKDPDAISKGLYAGGPGIALALVEGLNSGLLKPDADTIQQLQQCFTQPSELIDLSTGSAGEGIALLHCASWLESQFLQKSLHRSVENIIKSQRSDGSWNVQENTKRNDILTGLDKGVAGILWFLLSYIQYYADDLAKKAAYKGLDWLIRKSIKQADSYSWTVSTGRRTIDLSSNAYGVAGIALIFIKAYEVLKEPHYRKIAESSLRKMPPRQVSMDFTLAYGLTGVGEVYLEAFRVFNQQQWKERADWIARLIANCLQPATELNAGYWIAQPSNIATADLFLGNSGLLHFLIRWTDPVNIKHPLDPIDISSNIIIE